MIKSPLLDKVRKHSRRVRLTKQSLPVFAFLIAALIIVWPILNQNKDKFTLAVVEPNSKTAHIEMENLRFFGLNDKKMPMTLKTPEVKGDKSNPDLARMKKPIATYQLEAGDVLVANSPYAIIDKKKQTVFFEDRVKGKTDSNYTIQASQILCDYEQGIVDSDSPVSINGPKGKLNAQGVRLTDKGNLILFKKKTTAVINNKNNKIHIISNEGVQIDQKKKTMTATNHAKVIQESTTLTADKIILYYTENKKERIEKIEALGHVILDNKKQKVTANQGIYYPKTQKATLEGNVLLTQGNHKMKGDKAILNLATGENELISNQRITGQLAPKEVKGEPK